MVNEGLRGGSEFEVGVPGSGFRVPSFVNLRTPNSELRTRNSPKLETCMTIEITSVPENLRTAWFRRFKRFNRNLLSRNRSTAPRRLFLKGIVTLLILAAIVGGDALLRSYKHYSSVIDQRLASGYLTSRPGLYAAPRTLRVGQGFTQDALVGVLRRAGYIETDASEVWSGSFKRVAETIELRPRRLDKSTEPRLVRIRFSQDRILELTGDELALDSFTLEPEVLTNELSSKTGQRETLAYNQIPAVLVHAILAIEDHRFFQHSGLDPFGVGRALLRNAGDERIGQGGSTITQQLVKNTYLSPEKTIRRKYAEAMLAFALERRLSKEDIFALYCNEVYLGQRGAVIARGVEQAAAIYFGKELKQLSLGEAATIAGMIQGPSRYSPERHPDATRARRDAVLAAMVREGWITPSRQTSRHANPSLWFRCLTPPNLSRRTSSITLVELPVLTMYRPILSASTRRLIWTCSSSRKRQCSISWISWTRSTKTEQENPRLLSLPSIHIREKCWQWLAAGIMASRS